VEHRKREKYVPVFNNRVVFRKLPNILEKISMNQTHVVPKFLSPEIATEGVEVTEHEEPPAVSLEPSGYAPCGMADSPQGCDQLVPPGQELCRGCQSLRLV
jgi:hypothetical protein